MLSSKWFFTLDEAMSKDLLTKTSVHQKNSICKTIRTKIFPIIYSILKIHVVIWKKTSIANKILRSNSKIRPVLHRKKSNSFYLKDKNSRKESQILPKMLNLFQQKNNPLFIALKHMNIFCGEWKKIKSQTKSEKTIFRNK